MWDVPIQPSVRKALEDEWFAHFAKVVFEAEAERLMKRNENEIRFINDSKITLTTFDEASHFHDETWRGIKPFAPSKKLIELGRELELIENDLDPYLQVR